MKKKLENLSAKQSGLETKYQKLEQTISDMQEELTKMQASMSCEKNWTQFKNHCYLYLQEQTFLNVLATCKTKDSYLVEITSESKLKCVAGLAAGDSVGLWIGATDTQPEYEGTFVYHVNKKCCATEVLGR